MKKNIKTGKVFCASKTTGKYKNLDKTLRGLAQLYFVKATQTNTSLPL